MQVSNSTNASILDYINSIENSSKGSKKSGIAGLLKQASVASNPVIAGISNQVSKSDIYKSTVSDSNSVLKYLEALTDSGSDSVFANAEAEGNTDVVVTKIGSMVVSYNKMLEDLSKEGGKTNQLYMNTLLSVLNSSATDLEKVGISINKDGSLATDYTTLFDADLEDLKAVFGSGSDLAEKLTQTVNGIQESSAKTANLIQIYSTAYSNSGSYSKYDYIKNLYDSLA